MPTVPPQSLLLVPSLASDSVLRALVTGGEAQGVAELVASICVVSEAQITAVRLKGAVDLDALAASLSVGGAAVAVVHPDQGRWTRWEAGQRVADLGEGDALVVPLDASGDPDFDAVPRSRSTAGSGPFYVVRTALDVGMREMASCRFRPIEAVLEDHAAWRHFVLIRHGHRVVAELPS